MSSSSKPASKPETCTTCFRKIDEGDAIVTCAECGRSHHEACWDSFDACISCGATQTMKQAIAQTTEQSQASLESDSFLPAMTITTAEVNAAPLPPPKPKRKSPEEVAAEFATTRVKPSALPTVAAAVPALFSLVAVPGILLNVNMLTITGIAFAVIGLVLGMLVFVMSWASGPLRPLALVTALVCGTVAPTAAILREPTESPRYQERSASLNIDNARPSEAQLSQMPEPIASALRNNVVIVHESLVSNSMGSGVVTRIDDNTIYILTNKHVLGKGSVTVYFSDGAESSAETVWQAPGDIDLAFISCRTQSPPSYEPPALRKKLATPGDSAFAVGNPMNLLWSYTDGVISSVRRQHSGTTVLQVYQIQTPINPGNSGGGLYDKDGQLIAINTWTHDKSLSEGIGFSISTTSLLSLLTKDETERFVARRE